MVLRTIDNIIKVYKEFLIQMRVLVKAHFKFHFLCTNKSNTRVKAGILTTLRLYRLDIPFHPILTYIHKTLRHIFFFPTIITLLSPQNFLPRYKILFCTGILNGVLNKNSLLPNKEICNEIVDQRLLLQNRAENSRNPI